MTRTRSLLVASALILLLAACSKATPSTPSSAGESAGGATASVPTAPASIGTTTYSGGTATASIQGGPTTHLQLKSGSLNMVGSSQGLLSLDYESKEKVGFVGLSIAGPLKGEGAGVVASFSASTKGWTWPSGGCPGKFEATSTGVQGTVTCRNNVTEATDVQGPGHSVRIVFDAQV